MPRLEFRQGEQLLFHHLFYRGRLVLGRSDQCDVALPSDAVSRIHCRLERQSGGWWVTDESRHGTRLNGTNIERERIDNGDVLSLGPYEATFCLASTSEQLPPTASRAVHLPVYEELLDGSSEATAVERAEIVFRGGSRRGESTTIARRRASVGGPGADIELDDGLPPDAVVLRVVRGRVMIEPGSVPASLEGIRVRELTPVLPGEAIQIGEHTFVVQTRTHEETATATSFGNMVGRHPSMCSVFGALSRIARHDARVLLTGESGTGKEVAAQGIHSESPVAEGPFVALNCAGIPDSLFESELFGHEKGAFSGAVRRADGAFQRADGGTLFLDEVGELRLDAQAKLLRVLESGEVRRVGGAQVEYPDVRIVCATNQNLPKMVSEGSFRQDLYFRLAVIEVRIPALRERPTDIPLLAQTLLARNHPDARLDPSAVPALQSYDWPGNVRELRNVLTRAFVLGGPLITREHLSFNPWAFEGATRAVPSFEDSSKVAIITALERHAGNRTRAAQDLGIPRSSLLYKMKKLGIR